MAKAANEVDENGCKDCKKCPEMSDCIQSLRRAVGYIAECMARIIESNQRVNMLLLEYMKKGKEETKDFEAFYS